LARASGPPNGVLPRGRRVATRFGAFDVHCFAGVHEAGDALAVTRGPLGGEAPLLARVHSSCVTSEVFGGRDCDCSEQLAACFERIAAAGRGVLFYLPQEGRGAGLVAKARDRMMVQASRERLTTFEAYARLGLPRDVRRYDAVATMAAALGIRAPLVALTNNPDKVAGLLQAGVALAGSEPLARPPSPFNAHYLEAKWSSGHALPPPVRGSRRAVPPEAVPWIEPEPVAEAPGYWWMASYLLPVAPARGDAEAAPRWLRVRVYRDPERGRTRPVLSPWTRGAPAGAPRLRRVQRHQLVDRLPLRRTPASLRRWRATLDEMTARGSGRVLFLDPDEQAAPDAATAALLDHEPARG